MARHLIEAGKVIKKLKEENEELLEAVIVLYERYVKHNGHPDMKDKLEALIKKNKK